MLPLFNMSASHQLTFFLEEVFDFVLIESTDSIHSDPDTKCRRVADKEHQEKHMLNFQACDLDIWPDDHSDCCRISSVPFYV